MAKPRVFVSSTYYDLKYARERLERFIESYNMEPVLFESDEVYFNPTQDLDISCYKEVESCHIMVLIVGGRYGSIASEQKDIYEEKYISITQREYETARQKRIPVMVFVEQNVFAEYNTYLANKSNNTAQLNYAFVDDERVFQFISKLERGAIKVFGKVDDIEHYFSNQISGMLLDYLTMLKNNKIDNEIKSAVSQLEMITKTMQNAVNQIAEKVLENDKGKYEELLKIQKQSQIDMFLQLFRQSVDWGDIFMLVLPDQKYNDIASIFQETIFNWNVINSMDVSSYRSYLEDCKSQCEKMFVSRYSYKKLNIHIHKFGEQLRHIASLIVSDSNLRYYFSWKLPAIIKGIAETSWLM